MKPSRRLVTAVAAGSVLLAAVFSASAAKPEVKPDVTRLLESRLGGMPVQSATETSIEGVYETRFGSKVAYLIGDGRYLLMGDLIDLQSQVNLTELSRREIANAAIEEFPVKDLVVFPAEGETKRVLNVFTDSSCGYCQKLHEEVPYLQEAGIEVRYFPFPRGGARGPGYQDLRKVWCAKDRSESMNVAKGVSSGDLVNANCEAANIVNKGYQLGNKLGVNGTPALFTDKGRKLDGYVPYKQLIPMLLSDS